MRSRMTYERLTQAINEARDRGDMELLERIAKNPLAFILKQGWAAVSLDGDRSLMEPRSLSAFASLRLCASPSSRMNWRVGHGPSMRIP